MGTVENHLLMIGDLLPRKKIYDDILNYTRYYCDAKRGSGLTDPVWRVRKVVQTGNIITGLIYETTQTDGYTVTASNLSAVQNHSYS